MGTVTVITLGCKVNQFESEALIESLEKAGYRIVSLSEEPDITIVNTCTVTHRADFQARQMVRRAHRSNAKTLLIVTGCYAQVDAERLSKIEGVRYIFGNEKKPDIPSLLPLMEKGELAKVQVEDIRNASHFKETPLHSFHRHTRAFLKIQDGCNGRCSYCIVPAARGRSRSLIPERVFERLKKLKERGYKEVVLTGIHLGAYGLDLYPPVSLKELIEGIEESDTSPRVRLSSIEPGDFSPALISALSGSSKVCPHLHIPIQSGDDEILRRMNRNYDRSFLSDLLRELHTKIRDLCIGADVIAGFPGETDERFHQTFEWIGSLPLAYLHVFPFSRRKGTPAAGFDEGVGEETIKRRAGLLRVLGREKRQAFYRSYLHRELKVLIEGRRKKEETGWRGLSRNYIPAFLGDEDTMKRTSWINEEVNVRVGEVIDRGVRGQVVGS